VNPRPFPVGNQHGLELPQHLLAQWIRYFAHDQFDVFPGELTGKLRIDFHAFAQHQNIDDWELLRSVGLRPGGKSNARSEQAYGKQAGHNVFSDSHHLILFAEAFATP